MASGPTQTNAASNSQSVFQVAKQRLGDVNAVNQEAKNEFAAVDTDQNGSISKDELVASQTEGITDPREKTKLSDSWSQVFEAAAGKGGALHADQFANLVSAFTGHGAAGVQYHDRQQMHAENPVGFDQRTVEQNLTQRIEDLNTHKAQLQADLMDPKKAPEAMARIGLLNQQTSELSQVRHQIESFQPHTPMSEADRKATGEILGRMNNLIGDLSDPNKHSDAHAQLNTLGKLLHNPQLYNPKSEWMTDDKALKDQAIIDHNLSEHVKDLEGQQNQLIGDLSDPKKAPEAQARLGLINQQIGELKGLQSKVDGYQRPHHLSAADEKKTNDLFVKINQLTADLPDPKKAAEVRAQLTTATSLLHNPSLYDPKSPNLTNDPVLRNQSIVDQNLNQRLQDLTSQKNSLISALSDPSKQAEALARMQLLNQQIGEVSHLRGMVENYRRPANLSAEDVNKSADLMSRINDLSAQLSDPAKNAEAHGQMAALTSLLHNPSLYDPKNPGLTNDPAIKNQEVTAQNLSQRMGDLLGQANNLIGEMGNPQKAAEAQARLNLVYQQLNDVAHMRNVVENFRVPSHLDQAKSNQVADTFNQINQLAGDMADPKKAAETQGRMTELTNDLHHPGLKNDPLVRNQAITVQNISQRMQDLVGAQNQLLGDLSNPQKAAEAQARMQLLNRQIGELANMRSAVQSYVRPGTLTPDQDRRSADLMNRINGLTAELADPMQHTQAVTQLSTLIDQLKNPSLMP